MMVVRRRRRRVKSSGSSPPMSFTALMIPPGSLTKAPRSHRGEVPNPDMYVMRGPGGPPPPSAFHRLSMSLHIWVWKIILKVFLPVHQPNFISFENAARDMQNFRHDYPVSENLTDEEKCAYFNIKFMIPTVPDKTVPLEDPNLCKCFSFVTAAVIQIPTLQNVLFCVGRSVQL